MFGLAGCCIVDFSGEIVASDVFDHAGVNSATEYGALIEGGYVIFNDTDAGGDTLVQVGMIKVSLNGSNSTSDSCSRISTWMAWLVFLMCCFCHSENLDVHRPVLETLMAMVESMLRMFCR